MTGSTAEPDAESMRESDQKPVKTGIPNRKKTAFATALSCKNLYFPAPTKPAESTACRFFTGDSLMGQGREPLPDVDAFGYLCSLRARSALDGVSWVQSGSVEIAVGQRLAPATESAPSSTPSLGRRSS